MQAEVFDKDPRVKPRLMAIKNGWAALGDGWAVLRDTKDDAQAKFSEAEEGHRAILTRAIPQEQEDIGGQSNVRAAEPPERDGSSPWGSRRPSRATRSGRVRFRCSHQGAVDSPQAALRAAIVQEQRSKGWRMWLNYMGSISETASRAWAGAVCL